MIRLLLLGFGGWLAWRNRSRIQRFASRLPQIEAKTSKVVGEVSAKVKEGLDDIKEELRDASAGRSAGTRKASQRSVGS
jgi:hypothetical protein